MTVTAKGLDGSSGEGEEDTSAGFVKYCPIVLIKAGSDYLYFKKSTSQYSKFGFWLDV